MSLASWLKGLFALPASDPLVSIVLLLQTHRDLPENVVTLAAARAWAGTPYRVEWPRFHIADRTFIVQSVIGMFVEDLASKVKSGDVGAAVRRHRGWWSIDLQAGAADDEAYLLMGRLMAVLLNSNCLAVYYPQDGEIEIVDQETGTKLVTRR